MNCTPLVAARFELDRAEEVAEAVAELAQACKRLIIRQDGSNTGLVLAETDQPEVMLAALEPCCVGVRLQALSNLVVVAEHPLTAVFAELLKTPGFLLSTTPGTKKPTETTADCRKLTLIKSGEAQGTSSEVTLFSDVAPETITAARNEAIGNAGREAAAAIAAVIGEPCDCAEPCVCRYMVSFGAVKDAGKLDQAALTGAQDIKGLSVSVNVGKVTTVVANVSWSAWKACVGKGDAGFDKTPPPEREATSVTVQGRKTSVRCETSFKAGTAVVVRETVDEITWTGNRSEEDLGNEIRANNALVLTEAVMKASDEAKAALLGFDTCSTFCSAAEVNVFLEAPTRSTRGPFRRAYTAGYEDVWQSIGRCEWRIYKRCGAPSKK